MIDISFKPREYFQENGLNDFLQKELGLETKNIFPHNFSVNKNVKDLCPIEWNDLIRIHWRITT